MPNIVRTWGVVRVNRWVETVPRYRTVYIDRGHWAYRTVTRYRNERYRSTVRYRVRKTYWYRRGWRWYRGTRTEWHTRSVWKTRRVPYRTRQRCWVRKMAPEQRLVGYDEIEHRDPSTAGAGSAAARGPSR